MGGEWGETQLLRIAKLRSGFPFKSSSWVNDGIPVIKISNIKDGRIIADGCGYVSHETAATAREWVTQRDDVLIAMTGYVGEVALVRTGEEYLINQRVGRFEFIDGSPVIPAFFFYYLCQPKIRFIVETMARGSAQPNLSANDVAKLNVPVPPVAEQRAIAHILGTLDDKIELNRRMSETLEQMARALFKAWFVDFEPVRAKMEGRWQRGQSLPGLPAHLYDLFPDRLVESELGEIPEGWEVGRIADIGNVICGKTPSTRQPEYYGDDVPFITIPDMHGKIFAVATQKRLSHAGAASQQNKMLPSGAICVSCIATPGLIVITSETAQTNQQINSVIPNKKNNTFFWYWVLRELGEEIRASGSGGSVLSNLSTGRFADLRIIVPTNETRSAYHSRVTHLFDRILVIEREIITFAALRDTLLPKLISGEIRVKDAERFLKERGL